MHVAPSEIEMLSTFEFNRYTTLINQEVEAEVEEKKTLYKTLGPLAAMFSSKK